MHITIKHRCDALALNRREQIVGNSEYCCTEETLFIPLIKLEGKSIITCYRRRCARLDRLEEELVTGIS